uniref:Protein kinase domain-containing protein n=1 Tax=Syphacia muris TaxID=451379 RepID=A0A0N5AFJ3_9BILA
MFENVAFNRICTNAFSGLMHLKYFWFRNVSIGNICSYAFDNLTTVDYMYFRDANISSIDSYAFGNLHRINHLFFRGTINIYAVDNYAFKNSAIKVLVFEGYLQTTKYFLQYGRFRRLELLNSSTNTPILADVVKLLNCTVDRLDVTIFSTVTNVVIDNCQIDVVENDDEKFAEGIDSLVFRGTRIGTIANVSLTSATEVRFDRCRIDEISIGSLWLPNVAEIALFLLNSKVNDIQASPFLNAEIGHLIMANNEFLAGDFKTIFYGLDAERLDATNNSFVCDENDCETNSLFNTKTMHQISWNFDANICVQSEACKTEPQWSNQNMLCKFSRSIVKCYCKNDTPAMVPFVNTSILIMSDCAYLDLNSDAGLYISKFSAKLRRFELFSSKIDNFESYAFENSTVDNFLMHNSNIRQASLRAFDGAKIRNFLGNNSEFYDMNTFWSKTDNLTLLNSYVDNPEELFAAKRLCFKSLIVNCECADDYSNLTTHNVCANEDVSCNSEFAQQNGVCAQRSTADDLLLAVQTVKSSLVLHLFSFILSYNLYIL